jgi:hypothetical protein
MNLYARLALVAVLATTSGCLGGSGDGNGNAPIPPANPPAVGDLRLGAGIWTGELVPTGGEAMRFHGLVSESGEVRLVLDDQTQTQQIYGQFVEGAPGEIVADSAEWDIEVWTEITLRGSLDVQASLTGEFESSHADIASGTFSFAYDDAYERDSSLTLLAGRYATGQESLTIDSQGALLYQSSDDHCVGTGAVELLNPDYNMYRVSLVLDSCTGDRTYLNGAAYYGLAYLGDSEAGTRSDTFQLALSTQGANCPLVCFESWNLAAQRSSSVGGHWSGVLEWESRGGFPGGVVEAFALVAETGEFHFVLTDELGELFDGANEQIFGNFESDGSIVRTNGDSVWSTALGAGNPLGEYWASFGFSGALDQVGSQLRISGPFQANWTSFEERVGSLELYSSRFQYERPSSLELLAATYTTANESLTIDEEGVIFYQSSANGCTGNGSAEVIDARFNMYRVEIVLDNCTGANSHPYRLTFRGLAYVGDNNDPGGGFLNSTLVMAVSAKLADGISGEFHYRIPWSLLAHK